MRVRVFATSRYEREVRRLLTELEQAARGAGFDTKGSGFSKKNDRGSKIFWIVAAVVGVLIVGVLLYALMIAGK